MGQLPLSIQALSGPPCRADTGILTSCHVAVGPQDVIVHVRDVSHPETELQKVSVLSALRGLRLPDSLVDSALEVHNKVDLVPG